LCCTKDTYNAFAFAFEEVFRALADAVLADLAISALDLVRSAAFVAGA
jgi:hypothetical protein